MIQFLNIAGTGPIFGAIMGAWYGPVAYLWIIFGCVFAGAMHDYMSGMLSLRNGGAGLPELVGKYLGIDNRTFRDAYEDCYTKALEIYDACDMFFFVTNQKFFAFSGVYTIQETPLSRFEKTLRKQKAAVDRIAING